MAKQESKENPRTANWCFGKCEKGATSQENSFPAGNGGQWGGV